MKRYSRWSAVTTSAVLMTASALASGTGHAALAQTPSPQAVKAARDATAQARSVTLHLDPGDATVSLQRIGRTRTRVRVLVPQGGNYRFRLYPGSDCNSSRGTTASAVALAPMNTAGPNAVPSETIVNLPIEQVSQNYLIDVQNATTNAQVANACARLSP
jgi:hypothetical protein